MQLLQDFSPHLGKSLWCIYVWDQKVRHFRYEPEIPEVDPIPHPENKTITVHEDWQGGPFMDSTYRWNGAKLQLLEQNGTSYGSDNPDCGFADYCGRLINRKMVTTASKPFGCSGQQQREHLACSVDSFEPAG